MGVEATITATTFPRQGQYLGREVEVFFHYDTARKIRGRIIRDDAEAPFRTFIMLTDERIVLATECQYAPLPVPR